MYESSRERIQGLKLQDQNITKIFMTAFANFALKQLQADMNPLFEAGFFGPDSVDLLEAAYKQTLVDLRPQMLSLAELAFPCSAPTTIGNEYGDMYEM